MRLVVVGCGDAFGSGGRHQTCFLVETPEGTVMLDCGATTTTALNKLGRDPNGIGTIVISHLHGDHFGGLVFLVVQALFGTSRKAPLTVFGPAGIEARYKLAMEALFPGFVSLPLPFALRFVEMTAGVPVKAGPLDALALEVDHPAGAPSHGLRLQHGGRTLAFSGDTRWTANLPALGAAANLYVIECYAPETTSAAHLTWTTLQANLDVLGAQRYLLTHMNAEMIAKRAIIRDPRVICAEDGMTLDI